MGKVKASTLQQRFGFSDPELKTPTHDAICSWVEENAAGVAVSAVGPHWSSKQKRIADSAEATLPELRPLTVQRVEWEPLLKNGRGYEVGFADMALHIKTCGVGIFSDGYFPNEKKRFEVFDVEGIVYIECKTTVASLGELFRQLQMYRSCIKKTWPTRLAVVSPDGRHAERIAAQGFPFIKPKL